MTLVPEQPRATNATTTVVVATAEGAGGGATKDVCNPPTAAIPICIVPAIRFRNDVPPNFPPQLASIVQPLKNLVCACVPVYLFVCECPCTQSPPTVDPAGNPHL